MTNAQGQMKDRLDRFNACDIGGNIPGYPRLVAFVAVKRWAKRYLKQFQSSWCGNGNRKPAERSAAAAAQKDFEKEQLEETLKEAQKKFDMKFADAPKQKKQEMQKLLDEQFTEARKTLARKQEEERNPGAGARGAAEEQNAAMSLPGRLSERPESRTIKTARQDAGEGATDHSIRHRRLAWSGLRASL